MNTKITPFAKALFFSLLLTTLSPTTRAANGEPDKEPADEQSFAISLFMGAQKKIHLLLDLRLSRWVEVTLKDHRNTVIHRIYVKKAVRPSRIKYDFRESDPGLYRLEISDGKQTVLRQVEVIDMPTVEPYRYITLATK